MSAQAATVVPLVVPLIDPQAAGRGVILHVDDDEPTRRATAMLLRTAGYETREAATGEQALALAATLRGRLDVLIADFHLGGGLTGTEVAEDLARVLGHAVPTIILTGDLANAEVPWLAGAPVWLAHKPLNPDTLLAALPPLVAFRRAVAATAPH